MMAFWAILRLRSLIVAAIYMDGRRCDGIMRLMDGVSLNAPTEISANWWQEQGPNSRGGPGLRHHRPQYIASPSLIH